jgi:hypothetical protein
MQWQKGLGAIQLLSVFAGLAMLALGVINGIVGIMANMHLAQVGGTCRHYL